MRLKYLLLSIALILVDILTYTEIAQLLRQPSDGSVLLGLLLLIILIGANYITIRYLLTKTLRP